MTDRRRIRLFAALELPGDVRAALAGWAVRAVGRNPAVRPVSPAALHVTLVFLGTQPAEDAAAIGEAVLAQARPLAPLTVRGAAWLPARRPRVLVVDLFEDGDALSGLQRAVAAALSARHEPEARPFRPHVTVARVRRGARPAQRDVLAPPRLIFDVPALVLYRSLLRTGGASYEPVARTLLR